MCSTSLDCVLSIWVFRYTQDDAFPKRFYDQQQPPTKAPWKLSMLDTTIGSSKAREGSLELGAWGMSLNAVSAQLSARS
jgi:hypothetical protein